MLSKISCLRVSSNIADAACSPVKLAFNVVGAVAAVAAAAADAFLAEFDAVADDNDEAVVEDDVDADVDADVTAALTAAVDGLRDGLEQRSSIIQQRSEKNPDGSFASSLTVLSTGHLPRLEMYAMGKARMENTSRFKAAGSSVQTSSAQSLLLLLII